MKAYIIIRNEVFTYASFVLPDGYLSEKEAVAAKERLTKAEERGEDFFRYEIKEINIV